MVKLDKELTREIRAFESLESLRSSHVRETSADTYHAIVDSGLLSKMRMDVYKALYKHGPCDSAFLVGKTERRMDRNIIQCRLGELTQARVANEVGYIDSTNGTKRTVICYDVTNNLPGKVKKPDAGPRRPEAEEVEAAVDWMRIMSYREGFDLLPKEVLVCVDYLRLIAKQMKTRKKRKE